ncbi:MAG: serine hydrolase domain-containing protein [Paracoccus sp. (in: a-proteobacteria)]
MADREAGRPMQPGAWFRYASVSKPFTTVAASRLMDQGRLSPENLRTRRLPEFTLRMQDGSQPQITADQLMSHLAGLDYGFNQPPDGSCARRHLDGSAIPASRWPRTAASSACRWTGRPARAGAIRWRPTFWAR